MLMTWCPLCTGCGQANVHCPNMRFGAGGLLPNWPYRSVGLVHWSLNVMSVVLSIRSSKSEYDQASASYGSDQIEKA